MSGDEAKRRDEEIVLEHELIVRAGFDLERYLGLSEHEQRMVLKMAEHLVNAARRAEDQGGATG